MDFELEKDFIEEHGLTEDQVKAVIPKVGDHVATLKKEWDGKANTDAEKILTGAADRIKDLTKVERTQGEKLADYYDRAWKEFNTTSLKSLEDQKKDLEEKMKKTPGNELLQGQMDELKDKYSKLQEKEAEYDKIIESGIQDKYKELQTNYDSLKERVAFQGVKPKFAEGVNEYEAAAKWKAFVDGVKDKNNIVIVDDEPIAVDKENEHKQTKLKDLVEKDESIQSLVEGRKQDGPGGKPEKKVKIDGLPFELPENADGPKRAEAIREYLLKEEKLSPTDRNFSKRFAELNQIALGKKKPEKQTA